MDQTINENKTKSMVLAILLQNNMQVEDLELERDT